jgi:hypothetical protein
MDLKELRDRALEATTRFFVDRDGILPDQEGEEWEVEYRRQYNLIKRHAPEPHRAPPERRAAPGHSEWPELAGSPAQKRWAAEVRDARLAAMENKDMRDWLAATPRRGPMSTQQRNGLRWPRQTPCAIACSRPVLRRRV